MALDPRIEWTSQIVGNSSDRERVEVELVADDGSSPFARPAPDDSQVATSEPTGPSQSRTTLIAVAVGVVALALGWALGSASDEGVVTERGADESEDLPSDPVETIATVPPSEVAISAPTPVPTVTPTVADDEASRAPVVVEAEVDVVAELIGQPIEIVAYGNGRQLFELDLTTSQLRTREVTAQPFGVTRLLVAPDWAVLASSDPNFPSTLVTESGPEQEIEIGPSWQIVGVADDESVWTAVPPPVADWATVVQRRLITGELTEEIALVPAPPQRLDPAGGVIVGVAGAAVGVIANEGRINGATGAVIAVAPTIAPITTGRLVALGAANAVVEECDEQLVCRLLVVDRVSGEQSPIGGPGAATGGLAPYAMVGSSSISPDNSMAVVEVLDPFNPAASQRSIGVMNIATGVVTEIGRAQDVNQVAWTPDSRFVLFIQGGRVVAYGTDNGATLVVIEEMIAMNAFALRSVDSEP